jgi:hypothetical protein
MFGGDLNRIFALRCIVTVNPFSTLAIFCLSTTLIFSYLMKIIEGPVYAISPYSQQYNNDFRYILNCFWYTLVTMTTVGYGDYVPYTNLGRFVGIIIAFTGTLFVAVLIICLQQSLSLNEVEKKTVNFVDRVANKEELKVYASHYYLNTHYYVKAKNKYLNELNSQNGDINKLKTLKRELKDRMYNRLTTRKNFKILN